MYSISNRCMLAELNISRWSARKLDRQASNAVTRDNHAQSDAARVNKHLLPKAALAKIETAANDVRSTHYHYTLPWTEKGARVLPTAIYLEYCAALREKIDAFDRAVADFLPQYDSYRVDGMQRLGNLWRADDYPSRDVVASKFHASLTFTPFPDVQDFRVDMADEIVDDMKSDMEKQYRSMTAQAMGDAWQRMHDVVSRMAERLSAYQPATENSKASGVFRDSLIENARDLCRILPALNIENDPRMDALRNEIELKLCARDASQLRDSDVERTRQAQDAAAIARKMGAFMGEHSAAA